MLGLESHWEIVDPNCLTMRSSGGWTGDAAPGTVPELGRRGATAAGRLLAAAADRAASAAERKLVSLLRSSGIGDWRLHYRAHGYELDVAFPGHQVAVEVDGWAFHNGWQSFQGDRRRQNALILAGWVVRFTWHDLNQRPGEVIAEINRSLLRNSRSCLLRVGVAVDDVGV